MPEKPIPTRKETSADAVARGRAPVLVVVGLREEAAGAQDHDGHARLRLHQPKRFSAATLVTPVGTLAVEQTVKELTTFFREIGAGYRQTLQDIYGKLGGSASKLSDQAVDEAAFRIRNITYEISVAMSEYCDLLFAAGARSPLSALLEEENVNRKPGDLSADDSPERHQLEFLFRGPLESKQKRYQFPYTLQRKFSIKGAFDKLSGLYAPF